LETERPASGVRNLASNVCSVPVPSMFAIVEQARPDDINGVLVLIDSREDAEGMAFELRRAGHAVVVRGWDDEPRK
jgi:hypothetical protein